MYILIVDDYPTNLKLLRAQLEAEHHTVLEASNGVEALRVLECEFVDAVISDILMPVMDGFQLCLEIRKSEKFSALPFILYTSTYNSPEDRQLARTVGADNYLNKPAPTPAILDALREAMEKTRPSAHSAISGPDETYVLKQYSEALVHKLEEKNTELQESERRLRDMLDNMELLALMLDREARITYCNDHFLRLTGWRRDEVRGQNWFELFIPSGLDHLKDLFAALLANAPGALHSENEILTRAGGRRLIQWNNTLLRSAAGAVIGTASIGEDITERDEAQRKLLETATRLQIVSRQVIEAQETERATIARELHDQLGQALSAVKLNLQVMQRRADAQPLSTKIDESIRAVSAAVQQVRTLALELRPPQLDDLGLVIALRSYANRLAATSELQIEVCAPELPPLPPRLDIACFRIAQEALTNIIRHADAKRVQIDLWTQDKTLFLGIKDDGKGFDVAAIRERSLHGHSMGLLGMEERACLVGGSLRIESSPGAGVKTHVEFPLESSLALMSTQVKAGPG